MDPPPAERDSSSREKSKSSIGSPASRSIGSPASRSIFSVGSGDDHTPSTETPRNNNQQWSKKNQHNQCAPSHHVNVKSGTPSCFSLLAQELEKRKGREGGSFGSSLPFNNDEHPTADSTNNHHQSRCSTDSLHQSSCTSERESSSILYDKQHSFSISLKEIPHKHAVSFNESTSSAAVSNPSATREPEEGIHLNDIAKTESMSSTGMGNPMRISISSVHPDASSSGGNPKTVRPASLADDVGSIKFPPDKLEKKQMRSNCSFDSVTSQGSQSHDFTRTRFRVRSLWMWNTKQDSGTLGDQRSSTVWGGDRSESASSSSMGIAVADGRRETKLLSGSWLGHTFPHFRIRITDAGVTQSKLKTLENDGLISPWIIGNESFFEMLTQRLAQAVAIYDCITVPYVLCFVHNQTREATSSIPEIKFEGEIMLSSIGLGCYVAVIFGSFFTEYIDIQKCKMVSYLPDIRVHAYSQLTFWADMLSCLIQFIDCLHRSTFTLYSQALRGMRLWRLFIEPDRFHGGTSENLYVNLANEVWHYLLILLLVVHVFGCLWWRIGGARKDIHDVDVQQPYMHAITESILMILGVSIPISLDWTSKLQMIWTCLASLIGSLYLAFVFAQFVLIIHRANLMLSHNKSQLALVWAASKSLNIPRSLQSRITGFHRFKALIKQYAHEELLGGVSKPLLLELKLFLLRHLIRSGAFFSDLDPNLISEIMLGFQEVIYSPGDIVIKKNDKSDSMYFIIRGICQVTLEFRGPCVAVLISGDFFGEMALLFPDKTRTAFVMCQSYCMFARLTVETFQKVVENSPVDNCRDKVLKSLETYLRRRVPEDPEPDPATTSLCQSASAYSVTSACEGNSTTSFRAAQSVSSVCKKLDEVKGIGGTPPRSKRTVFAGNLEKFGNMIFQSRTSANNNLDALEEKRRSSRLLKPCPCDAVNDASQKMKGRISSSPAPNSPRWIDLDDRGSVSMPLTCVRPA